MSNDRREPNEMSLADLVDSVRARIKRRNGHLNPVYYTLHDAWIDDKLLEEIGFIRLRTIESSGRNLADATPSNPPSPEAP